MYDYDKPDLSEDFLEHHGILGMHWGKRNGPPYPLGSDKSTGKRLKTGKGSVAKKKFTGSFVEKHRAKKKYKAKVKSAEAARQAKADKAEEARKAQEAQDQAEREALEREEMRQKVIRTGDVTYAKDHAEEFSNDEVNQIINRYQINQRLSGLADEEAKKVWDKNIESYQNQQSQQTSQPKSEEGLSRKDKKKQEALAKGDVKYANKHSKDFTEQELNDIMSKHRTDERINKEKEASESHFIRDAKKNKALKEADLEYAQKHYKDFSDQELNDIMNRYNTNQRLSKMVNDSNKKASVMDKAGKALEDLHKVTGPISTLAGDASKVYDLYSKISKDQNAKDAMLYKRKEDREQKLYDRKVAEDETRYKREQDALDRKERYDLGITKEEQQKNKNNSGGKNKDKSSNNNSQNEQKSSGKEEKMTRQQKKTQNAGYEVNKAVEKANIKANENKEGLKKIVSNKDTPAALQALGRDVLKNTRDINGRPVSESISKDWLASQSTKVLNLMKEELKSQNSMSAGNDFRDTTDRHEQASDHRTYTLQDINSILQDRNSNNKKKKKK